MKKKRQRDRTIRERSGWKKYENGDIKQKYLKTEIYNNREKMKYKNRNEKSKNKE